MLNAGSSPAKNTRGDGSRPACPLGVKMRNTRKEQIISASPLSTDIIKHERHVGKVPRAEVDQRVYSNPACRPLTFGLVLPVRPLHIIDFQVTGNGCANGWEKIL